MYHNLDVHCGKWHAYM